MDLCASKLHAPPLAVAFLQSAWAGQFQQHILVSLRKLTSSTSQVQPYGEFGRRLRRACDVIQLLDWSRCALNSLIRRRWLDRVAAIESTPCLVCSSRVGTTRSEVLLSIRCSMVKVRSTSKLVHSQTQIVAAPLSLSTDITNENVTGLKLLVSNWELSC